MYRLVKNIIAVLILSVISGSAVAQRDVADIEKMYFIQQKDGESDFTFSFCAIAYKGGEIALSYRLPTTVKINETIIAKNSNEQVALDTKYCSNQGIANLLLQHSGHVAPFLTKSMEYSRRLEEEGTETSEKRIWANGYIDDDFRFIYEAEVLNKATFNICYQHISFMQRTEIIRPVSKREQKEILAKYFTPQGVEKFIKEISGLDSVPEYETVVNIQ